MEIRNRKANRLKGWNYSNAGWYFVTICINSEEFCFGEIVDGKVLLNISGETAEKYLKNIPNVYQNVSVDEYIIMPDHVHMILFVVGTGQCPVRTNGQVDGKEDQYNAKDTGTGHCPVPTDNRYELLSKIINGYKNVVTKEIRNKLLLNNFKWHRSFYDHIIRTEESREKIKLYIKDNPINWVRIESRREQVI